MLDANFSHINNAFEKPKIVEAIEGGTLKASRYLPANDHGASRATPDDEMPSRP
jgi:hypothetical protein